MAKRMQEQKEEEERSVAKSKSTQLFRKVLHPNSPLASQEEPESRGERKLRIRRSVELSSATERCILWRVDGRAATGKLVATKEESGDVDLSESETGREEDEARKPNAPSETACQGSPKS